MSEVLLLHHCILNMNVRAPGISVWKGVVEIVLEALWMNRSKFLQIPCPEAPYIGMRRWWFVKEQYDNTMYRRFCRKLAMSIAEILKNEDIEKVKLVGLGLSPSCAYRETQSDETWGGKPREIDVSKNVVPGMGVFSEELLKALENFQTSYYDLPPQIIYPSKRGEHTSLYPKTFEEALLETAAELGLKQADVNLMKYVFLKNVDEDLRSGLNVVAPLEMAWQKDKTLIDYVEKGFGLVLIPELKTHDHAVDFYMDVLASQLENQARAGQKILFINHEQTASKTYRSFLSLLAERNLLKP